MSLKPLMEKDSAVAFFGGKKKVYMNNDKERRIKLKFIKIIFIKMFFEKKHSQCIRRSQERDSIIEF